jgi:hypothetical protein
LSTILILVNSDFLQCNHTLFVVDPALATFTVSNSEGWDLPKQVRILRPLPGG